MPYLGTTPSQVFVSVDYQDLTGVTGSPAKRGFTLDNSVSGPNEIEVFVNNVRQEPSVAYTVSGTTLTMTGDVETTDDFYVVYQGKAVGTVGHPAGNSLQATSGTFTADLTVDTNTLYVDSTNNRIGINNSSPAVDLDIGGSAGNNLRFTGSSSTTTGGFEFYTDTAEVANIGVSAGAGAITVRSDPNNTQNNSFIKFETDGTEVARFTDTQDFYVGTTSGTINSSNFGFKVESNGLTDISRNVGATTATLRVYGNAGELRVKGDGDCENTNNSYGAISDQTVKENIADASSQWDDIKALQVRKFSLIEHNLSEANQIGVIAQELEAAGMGGLVDTDDEGLKSVKYSVLYMKAVKALQEAQTRIEDLEARIAALEAN
jgi:hypothetical protein